MAAYSKEEILTLHASQSRTLTDYKLPRLADYFKELNTQNLCYTLADRVAREELWLSAKKLMLEDRVKLQQKIQMAECRFQPHTNLLRPQPPQNKPAAGKPVLESVGSLHAGKARRLEESKRSSQGHSTASAPSQ